LKTNFYDLGDLGSQLLSKIIGMVTVKSQKLMLIEFSKMFLRSSCKEKSTKKNNLAFHRTK